MLCFAQYSLTGQILTDEQAFATELAGRLGERRRAPRALLRRLVERCGVPFAREILRDCEAIQAAGGMLTEAGDRLRSPGGVFLYLARGRMRAAERHALFPTRQARQQRARERYAPFRRSDRKALPKSLLRRSGKVSAMKVSLTGRPGQIERRHELVITTMTHSPATPDLPRGVPPLPGSPLPVTVYVSARQWRKVEEALKLPQEELVVDGHCAWDGETGCLALHATRVSTLSAEALARARRQAESGTAASSD